MPWPYREMLSRGARLGRGGGKNTAKSLLYGGYLVAGSLWQFGKLAQ